MSEVTEVTGTVTQEVNTEIPTCTNEECAICNAKKEKTLHEIIVDQINSISKKKVVLLEKANSAQAAIDDFVKMDAEIQSGLVPEATLLVLKEILG